MLPTYISWFKQPLQNYLSRLFYLKSLTLTTQSRLLTTPKEMTYENIVGKGEPAFSPFPKTFSTLSNTEIVILPAFNLSSVNAFNLVQPRKLSFGKGLNSISELCYGRPLLHA